MQRLLKAAHQQTLVYSSLSGLSSFINTEERATKSQQMWFSNQGATTFSLALYVLSCANTGAFMNAHTEKAANCCLWYITYVEQLSSLCLQEWNEPAAASEAANRNQTSCK